jgi:hypothetical protein
VSMAENPPVDEAAHRNDNQPRTRLYNMTAQTNLSGKTALVTGGSRGIGRATALALASAGAQVIVHYSSGEKEATAVVAEIRNAGGKAEKVSADLRTANGPHHLAERVRTIIGGRLSTSSSPTRESQKRPRSRTPPSRTSTRPSRSTCARRTFSCSSYCLSCARAAA